MVKYVFVTGGVVSGLGKGITAASLGRLLKARGYHVTMQKFDPYINMDPGTMNPIQHGEVFVTDDGTEIGVPIEGAVFYRCDAEGTQYGDAITSDPDGNAVFNNVPFAEENAPTIYFKQTESDGEHTFSTELQNTTLTEETGIVEIMNAVAETREINVTPFSFLT